VKDERCENCKFWNDNGRISLGECRRRTPVFHPAQPYDDDFGYFPDVGRDGWCGEYQRKEEGK
jgi:hypothetical protein